MTPHLPSEAMTPLYLPSLPWLLRARSGSILFAAPSLVPRARSGIYPVLKQDQAYSWHSLVGHMKTTEFQMPFKNHLLASSH